MDCVNNPVCFKLLVRACRKRIGEIHKTHPFQAIVATGLSGASIAYPLSYLTGIPVFYIRKEGDTTHGAAMELAHQIEGVRGYLIVDDLIESGNTLLRLLQTMHNFDYINDRSQRTRLSCVGILLYNNGYGGKEPRDYRFQLDGVNHEIILPAWTV